MQVVSELGGRYSTEKRTYIRVFKSTKSPHVLPKLSPDKLALQEVAYHTLVHGVGVALAWDKKFP
jgi:hypothetical protein